MSSMTQRARLLRKKLREQKSNSKTPPKKPYLLHPIQDNQSNSNSSSSKEQKGILKPSDLLKKSVSPQKVEPEKKKKEEEIDPLNFFNVEHNEVKTTTGDKEINALLGLIEEEDKKEIEKKNNNQKKKDDEKEKNEDDDLFGSGSSSESDDGMNEAQRLMNLQKAQQNLFSHKDNNLMQKLEKCKPTKNKISEDLTKEAIMEKFGDDFDGAVELPELNEQKKQIMLKKMRKTINKLSSLRIQKHMDSELRHMIEDKIEDLKKIKGVNYSKIEGTVQELILSSKQPDFYFADDEDVHQITDVQEPYDIKPKTDIDFALFMKQTPKTN